jgi:putative phosphoribosyl transferase
LCKTNNASFSEVFYMLAECTSPCKCDEGDRPVLRVLFQVGKKDRRAFIVQSNSTAPGWHVVGGNDPNALELNDRAFQRLQCIKKLEIAPDATHLFEELDALEKVAYLANAWFTKYL